MTFSSLLGALSLNANYSASATDLSLAIPSISPDSNVTASTDPTTLSGSSLIAWCRWILVHKNFYNLMTPIAATTMVVPGESIYLLQLTAKDVLGPVYRPIVYSAKSVPLNHGSGNVVVTVPLQADDIIELTNVHISRVQQDQVTFMTRPMKSAFGWLPGVYIGGRVPQIGWVNIPPPGGIPPMYPSFPPVQLTAGDPVVIYEPVSVTSVPVTSISSYYDFIDSYTLPAS